jgi:Na+/H+-dicarboxylate symporter
MSNKTGQVILIGMLLGVILGALGGYYAGDAFLKIKFLGTIFLNALKMVAILLVIFSLIVGVASLGDIRNLGRTAGKTLAYFLATTGIAVLIGIILVNVIRPGAGVEKFGAGIPEIVAENQGKGLIDIIISMVPGNIFKAAAEGEMLGLIVFSLIFGGALTLLGGAGKTVIDLFDSLNKAIMKIVHLILYFAPIGVLALIGSIVAENHDAVGQLTSGLGLYTLTIIIGLLIHGTIILPIILKIFGKQDPLKYVKNMGQAFTTAFTTASSSATLPLTMEAVIDKNKIDKRAGSFVLPLGSTINMDGTALYEAVAAIFIAQLYGLDLSIGQQVVVFITATLASIGAAGIPHAGTVTMVFVLSAVGLPIEGIGLIWAVDWFLDRCRTTVNVWGDAIGSAVIAQTAEITSGPGRTAKAVPESVKPERAEFRKPRYERPERPQRTQRRDEQREHRSPRREDSQRKFRADKGRPDWKPDEEKTGRFRGRQDNREKGRREAPPIPKEKPERDLEKISKQLAAPAVLAEPPKEVVSAEEESKKDNFFDADFSKFDLLGDVKKEESTIKEAAENRSEETTSDQIEEPLPETASHSEPPNVEEPKAEENSGEEEDVDDGWGRSKRKRLAK